MLAQVALLAVLGPPGFVGLNMPLGWTLLMLYNVLPFILQLTADSGGGGSS